MSVVSLHLALTACAAAGIVLTLGDDDETFFAEPRAALTAELRDLLRQHKPEILAHLRLQTWDGAQALALTKQLTSEIRAWRAVAEPEGIEASRVVVSMLAQAVQARDMASLHDAAAWLDEARDWWMETIWPLPATERVA